MDERPSIPSGSSASVRRSRRCSSIAGCGPARSVMTRSGSASRSSPAIWSPRAAPTSRATPMAHTGTELESFEEVTQLDAGALRALFRRGRPEQRIWAIWALALKTGGLVGVADPGAGDPDAGVRRTMAIMLAGHGEHEMLIELARRDPVRAV